MATRTWNSSSSNDMNNGGNYTPTGTILSTDDLVFNGTSTVNATASADVSVNSITSTSAYTGSWTVAGHSLTLTGDFVWAAPYYMGMGTSLNLNGNTSACNISIRSAVNTSVSSCDVVINGNNTSWIENSGHGVWSSLTVSANAKVTYTLNSYPVYKHLSLGDNCTFTINYGSGGYNLAVQPNYDGSCITIGTGVTWNGTGAFQVVPKVDSDYHLGHVLTIPGITYTGTGPLFLATGSGGGPNTKITLMGHLNWGTNTIFNQCGYAGAGYNMTIDFATYNVTCGIFYIGSGTPGDILTLLAGTGSHTINTFIQQGPPGANSVKIYLQTSLWTCKGAWTNQPLWVTFDPGASQITFTTNSANLTSAGKSFYDLVFNGSTKSYAGMDNINCHSLTVTNGNWTLYGYTLTASGNVTYNGTGTINTGSIVMTGSLGSFYMGDTVGTITMYPGTITFQNTSQTLYFGKGQYLWGTFKVDNNASLTTSGSGAQMSLLVIGNNATLTNNSSTITVWGSISSITLGTGYVFNGISGIAVQEYLAGTVNIPSLIMTGSSSQNLICAGFYGGAPTTYNLLGDLIVPGEFYALSSSGTYSFTLKTNNYKVSVGKITIGTQPGLGAQTTNFYFGSSDMTCGNFNNAQYVGDSTSVCNLYMQKSNWNATGNWAFGSKSNVVHQWDKINFNADATITSNNKYINWMSVAAGKTLTLNDNLQCRDIQLYGTLNTNYKIFSKTCDIIEVSHI